ncbi:MAG: hypothetical protein ACR2NB_08495 [Solirubrobacteraceae bacterium]
MLTQASRLISAVNALGINARTALERGEIDAAIYLLDQAGADFGYRYEWERYGPFSETLAADVVELTDEDLLNPADTGEAVKAAVEHVRPLIEEPAAGLKQFTWIRLLASLDFLQRFAGEELGAGGHPAYIEANFEQSVIETAIERLRDFAD